VPDYSPRGTGFEPHARRPLLGSLSLNRYRSMTGNLNTAKKGAGHPTSLCRYSSIMGVAMYPSATLTRSMKLQSTRMEILPLGLRINSIGLCARRFYIKNLRLSNILYLGYIYLVRYRKKILLNDMKRNVY